WHLVTSPITTGTAGVFEDIWLRPYDEAHNTFGDYIVPTETPMPTGEGFSVWANTNETRTFTGTINNDAVNLTLQRTPDGGDVLNFGWNLIGNPYPCAIDLDAASGWTKNNVGRAVYVWDGGLSGGQYRVYLAATGTEQGIAANGGSRYVAMGQGFFVQAITDGATITMDKPVRVHNAIEFRDSEMIPDMININVSGNGYFDESVIYYKAEASENFDFDYDAAKLYGTSAAPQLYTKKQDNLLTINSINDFDELNGKYVYLEVGAAGEYMFEFSHSLAGYSPGVRDLFTDQYIYPEQNYVFFANPDDNPQRFQFAYDFTSIDEESKNDISVWAFENILRVEAQNGEAINEISIYSIHGQLLMKFNETEKDLSGLAPAVYVVRVNSNDEVKIEKIVIK
ncbi:MAG: T9SS type A sorting domain-containing protein, partial [Bacteroidales bacterium]|nr:T9SS type A sorting domain-containing protein [Bacteroidales bacterium]